MYQMKELFRVFRSYPGWYRCLLVVGVAAVLAIALCIGALSRGHHKNTSMAPTSGGLYAGEPQRFSIVPPRKTNDAECEPEPPKCSAFAARHTA